MRVGERDHQSKATQKEGTLYVATYVHKFDARKPPVNKEMDLPVFQAAVRLLTPDQDEIDLRIKVVETQRRVLIYRSSSETWEIWPEML
jgi:hypothetical protein